MDDDYYDCYDDEFDAALTEFESDDKDTQPVNNAADDPEHFHYNAVSEAQVLAIINPAVDDLSERIGVSKDLAKNLLIQHKWDSTGILSSPNPISHDANKSPYTGQNGKSSSQCAVCLQTVSNASMMENACGHKFCCACWNSYLVVQIDDGRGFDIKCMDTKCDNFLGEEFILELLSGNEARQKFHRQYFRDCIESHSNFALCATHGCGQVFWAEHPDNKRISCDRCKEDFCFACGCEYHLPSDCRTIRHWWRKLAEDANTASYMAAHTKDCPSCEKTIEKNGGCNHMVCSMCRYEFCWICMGEWKVHARTYYKCNRFTAGEESANNPDNSAAPKDSEARIALKKYLFYFTRWKGHEESLGLEQKLFAQIEERVQTKIQSQQGTLIDWQYLMEAGKLLLKCRRALQYTYALAYYLEDGPKRQLFEHLQADLESGIENLSFSIERAETVGVADLQALMRSSEFRRKALFKDAKLLVSPLSHPEKTHHVMARGT